MFLTKKSLPRRTFLRGAGAVIALPILDAMTPAASAAPRLPPRLGFIYVPHGADLNSWTPAKSGADFEFAGRTRIFRIAELPILNGPVMWRNWARHM